MNTTVCLRGEERNVDRLWFERESVGNVLGLSTLGEEIGDVVAEINE
jgi:hypothetical protein